METEAVEADPLPGATEAWIQGKLSNDAFFAVFYADPRVRRITADTVSKNALSYTLIDDVIQHGAMVLLRSRKEIDNPSGVYSLWWKISHFSSLSVRKKHPFNEEPDSNIEGGRDDKQFGLYGSRMANDNVSVFIKEEEVHDNSIFDHETRKSRERILSLNLVQIKPRATKKEVAKTRAYNTKKRERLKAKNHEQSVEMKKARAALDLSVREFADILGVNSKQMSNYINGISKAPAPVMKLMRQYCKGLKL